MNLQVMLLLEKNHPKYKKPSLILQVHYNLQIIHLQI